MLEYEFSNQSDKKKDAMFKQHSTAQDARPYILTLKGFGYGQSSSSLVLVVR